MKRFLAALTIWLGLAAPALSECAGQDLRAQLDPEQRAEIAARLAETPYAEGNHWRATRGQEVIHLVGTVHLPDPRLDGPTDRLRPLVEGAGALLLEMAAPEQAALETAMKTRPEIVVISGNTLPELLSEDDWARLSEAMRDRGIPPFMGAKMQPWLISMMLAMPPCIAPDLAEQNGLDHRLEKLANAAGVPVQSLESYEAAIGIFGETPMETQLAMIRSALIGPQVSEDLFATMLGAYFDEAHAETMITLDVLTPELTPLTPEENAAVSEMMQSGLIEGRNRAWLPVLLQAVEQTDGPVVAAFGAAHLGGEAGMLRLLEQEGFTLDRLPF